MNNLSFIFIIIIIIFIIRCVCRYKLVENISNESFEIYHYYGGKTAPSIMIIASMHGDEPAPYYAAKNVIKLLKEGHWKYPGEIWVIPTPNEFGLRWNLRNNKRFRDLNRQFKKKSPDKDARRIMKLAHEITYVIDLHEGYDFNKINNASYGSTVYYGLEHDRYIGENIARVINKKITDPNKKFGVFKEDIDTIEKGSLNHWRLVNNQSSFLIETTGKLNKQPLDIRVQQHLDAVYGLLTAVAS